MYHWTVRVSVSNNSEISNSLTVCHFKWDDVSEITMLIMVEINQNGRVKKFCIVQFKFFLKAYLLQWIYSSLGILNIVVSWKPFCKIVDFQHFLKDFYFISIYSILRIEEYQ